MQLRLLRSRVRVNGFLGLFLVPALGEFLDDLAGERG
jgi:hypothetical protein